MHVSVAWGRSSLVLSLGWAPLLVLGGAQLLMRGRVPLWAYAGGVVATLVGFVVMFPLYVKYVPLVKR